MTTRRQLLQQAGLLAGQRLLPPGGVALAGLPLHTGTAAAEADAAPPPARVGQLLQAPAQARMRLHPAAPWEPALLNAPLATGSALATEGPGMAAMRLGSTAVYMAPTSQVRWAEISDAGWQLEVVSGMASVRLRTLAPGERVLVNAGGVRVQLLKPGLVRVRHTHSGTRLVVWLREGQARVLGGGAAGSTAELMLGPDQHVVLERKTSALLSTGSADEARPFDGMVELSERRSETSFARLNVSAELTGIESLDGHGSWRHEAGLGSAWFPARLPIDWAPYRMGRWRWIPPWGWTWLDDAPWGFAPFHYGRWLFVGGQWAWLPGPQLPASAAQRPVYAPALVGFYGNAAGAVWSPPGAAAPMVGWYPLAPGEVYWPPYSKEAAYVSALNAAHGSDAAALPAGAAAASATPNHRYARTSFAATAMPYATFSTGQAVAGHQLPLSPAALAQAPLTTRRAPPPGPDAPAPGAPPGASIGTSPGAASSTTPDKR